MDNFNDFSRIDEVVKNALGNFSETPSSNLWHKMKWNLFRRDVTNFFRVNKNSGVENVPLYKAVWFQISAIVVVSSAIVCGIVYVNNQNETTHNDNYHGSILNNSDKMADNTLNSRISTIENNDNSISQNNNSANINNNINQNVADVVMGNNQTNNQTQSGQNDGSTDQNSNQSENTNDVNPAINDQATNDNQVSDQNTATDAGQNDQTPPDDDNDNVTSDEDGNGIVDGNDDNNSNFIENGDDEEVKLYIPNSFTPNSDGLNDYFTIVNIEFCPQNMLIVTDRQGHIVYQRFDYQNDWNARDIPDDTYYYVFTYKSKSGKDVYKRGLLYITRTF